MARVNANHYTAFTFCLVGQQFAQALKGPLVKLAALGCAATLTPSANLGQVFNHNRRACFDAINDTPTHNVVAVSPKPCHAPRQPFEMSSSALGAFGLQAALEPEVSSFGALPAAVAIEVVVRGYSRASFAEVNPNHIRRLSLRGGQGNNKMDKEGFAFDNQVAAIKTQGLVNALLGIVVHGDRHNNPALDGGQAHTLIGLVVAVAANIITNGRKRRGWARNDSWLFTIPGLERFIFQDQGRRQGFGRPHTGGNHKLGWQVWEATAQIVVGCLMQLYTVLAVFNPAMLSDRVKALGVLPSGLQQNALLVWRSS